MLMGDDSAVWSESRSISISSSRGLFRVQSDPVGELVAEEDLRVLPNLRVSRLKCSWSSESLP